MNIGWLRCAAGLSLLLLFGSASPARALFHIAEIDEFMTSYGGDPNVQFVEIEQLIPNQNIVTNTVLGAFDASGSYLGDVLVVLGNVLGGTNRPWLMGTAAFQTLTSLAPDFIMPPSLPIGGGMICWGAPGALAPPPGSWDHTNPNNYTDCVAYGTYSGPTNSRIGTPTPLDADGHSLIRTQDTNDSHSDFTCSDPANPTNNAPSSTLLSATVACTALCGNLLVESGELCDDGNLVAGDGCEPDCTFTVAVPVPALPSWLLALLGGLLFVAGGWRLSHRAVASEGDRRSREPRSR